jgi:hypothetical protein
MYEHLAARWSAFVWISVNNQHYQSRGLKRIDFRHFRIRGRDYVMLLPFSGNQIRVIIMGIKKHPDFES